jgi:hypothetical protein
MRLVEFETTNGLVWINPEHVISVEPSSEKADRVIIYARPLPTGAVSWFVDTMTVEQVIRELMGPPWVEPLGEVIPEPYTGPRIVTDRRDDEEHRHDYGFDASGHCTCGCGAIMEP